MILIGEPIWYSLRGILGEISMGSPSPFCRKRYLYLGNTYVPLQCVQEQLKIFDRCIHDRNRYWWTGGFACSVVEELYSNAPQILWDMVKFLLLPSFVCCCGPLALTGRGKKCSHSEAVGNLLIDRRLVWRIKIFIYSDMQSTVPQTTLLVR